MRRLTSTSFLVAAGVVALWTAPAAAQETTSTVLAVEARATSIAAYGGVVAWSSFDPAAERYRLRVLVDGRAVAVRVPSRTVPFDVDVGPDRRGRPTLVYSRCRKEAQPVVTFTGLPSRRFAQGCDLYRLVPAEGRESKLSRLSSSRASETMPSIWRDRVAYVRVAEPRGGRRAEVPRIMVAGLQGKPDRRLRGGTVGDIERFDRDGPAIDGPDVTALDLRGTTAVYAWSYVGGSCAPADPTGVDPLDPPKSTQVWIESSSGRRQLDRACDANGRVGATFAGSAASWLRQLAGNRDAVIASDRSSTADDPVPQYTASFAVSGTWTFVVHASGAGGYQIVQLPRDS